eukprot:jgi/Picsp_1/143/NSC_00143-R1_hypothetical protein COCSUDRAFT_59297 [Coccomyxa subellipsoidea C-169]
MDEVMTDKIDSEREKGENGSPAGSVEERLPVAGGEQQWGKYTVENAILTMPFTQTVQAAEGMVALAESPEEWLAWEMKKLRDRWCRTEETQAGSLTGRSLETPTCELSSLQGEAGKLYLKVEDYYSRKNSGDPLCATKFQVLYETVKVMSPFVFEKDESRIHGDDLNSWMYYLAGQMFQLEGEEPPGQLLDKLTLEGDDSDEDVNLSDLNVDLDICESELVKNVEDADDDDYDAIGHGGKVPSQEIITRNLLENDLRTPMSEIRIQAGMKGVEESMRSNHHGTCREAHIMHSESLPLPNIIGPSFPNRTEESGNIKIRFNNELSFMPTHLKVGTNDLASPALIEDVMDDHQLGTVVPDSQTEGLANNAELKGESEIFDNCQPSASTLVISKGDVREAMDIVGNLCAEVNPNSQTQKTSENLRQVCHVASQYNDCALNEWKDVGREENPRVTRGEANKIQRMKLVSSVMAAPGTRPDLGCNGRNRSLRLSTRQIKSSCRTKHTRSARSEDGRKEQEYLLSGLNDTADCIDKTAAPTAENNSVMKPSRRSSRLINRQNRQSVLDSSNKKGEKTQEDEDHDRSESRGSVLSEDREVEIRTKPHLMIATVPQDSQIIKDNIKKINTAMAHGSKKLIAENTPVQQSASILEDQTVAAYIRGKRESLDSDAKRKRSSNQSSVIVVGCSKCRYRGCSKCRSKAAEMQKAEKEPKLRALQSKGPPSAVKNTQQSRGKYDSKTLFKGMTFLVTKQDTATKQEFASMITSLGGLVEPKIPKPRVVEPALASQAPEKMRLTRNIAKAQNPYYKDIDVTVAMELNCRTPKSLYSRITGIPIVSPEWIKLCKKKRRVCSLESDSAFVLRSGEENREGLLNDVSVHVAMNKDGDCFNMLLQHAGARVLMKFNPDKDAQKCDLIIFGCEDDGSAEVKREMSSIRRMARTNKIPCFPRKWAIDGFLRGEFYPPFQKKSVEIPSPSPMVRTKRSLERSPKRNGSHSKRNKTPSVEKGLSWTLEDESEAPAGLPSSAVRHYYNVMTSGFTHISVGDFVELAPIHGEDITRVAKVLGLWMQHGLADGEKPFGRFQRYYRIHETSLSSVFGAELDDRKIFRSKHIEESVPLSAVVDQCFVQVIDAASPSTEQSPRATQNKQYYICVAEYDHEIGTIAPLHL